MKRLGITVLILLFTLPLNAGAGDEEPKGNEQPENVYIVSGYRYEPGGGDDNNSDIGQSLCGARCNALSVDYLNYNGPGGWRLIKVADKRELSIDPENPFLTGTCICVADEYRVKVHELYISKKNLRDKEVE